MKLLLLLSWVPLTIPLLWICWIINHMGHVSLSRLCEPVREWLWESIALTEGGVYTVPCMEDLERQRENQRQSGRELYINKRPLIINNKYKSKAYNNCVLNTSEETDSWSRENCWVLQEISQDRQCWWNRSYYRFLSRRVF